VTRPQGRRSENGLYVTYALSSAIPSSPCSASRTASACSWTPSGPSASSASSGAACARPTSAGPGRARGHRLAQPRRGLDRALVHSLATCAWIAQRRNLLLTGPTGIGKSGLGEAFAERASTLITSQVPVKGSHDLIGEPTHADATCDRLIHTAYVIELQGPSLRETRARA
jgi:hypothetical protein